MATPVSLSQKTSNSLSPKSPDVLTVLRLHEYRIKTRIPARDFDSLYLSKAIANILKLPDGIPMALFRSSKTEGSYTSLNSPESYATLKRCLKVKRRIQIMVVPLQKFTVSAHIKKISEALDTEELPADVGSKSNSPPNATVPESAQKTCNVTAPMESHPELNQNFETLALNQKQLENITKSIDYIAKAVGNASEKTDSLSKKIEDLTIEAEKKSKPGLLAQIHNVAAEMTLGSQRNSLNTSASTSKLYHFARCDKCKVRILGTRYKCFNCPDFDLCSKCFAGETDHVELHDFVRISFPNDLIVNHSVKTLSKNKSLHPTIFCDGPMCKDYTNPIYGTRYKCLICDDFDLCDTCENSHLNKHDPNHPMIKFKNATHSSIPDLAKQFATAVIRPRHDPIRDIYEKSWIDSFLEKYPQGYLDEKRGCVNKRFLDEKETNVPEKQPTEKTESNESTPPILRAFESSPKNETETSKLGQTNETETSNVEYTALIDNICDADNVIDEKKCYFFWIKNTTSLDILSNTNELKCPDSHSAFLPSGTKLAAPSCPEIVSFESTCEIPFNGTFSFVVHIPQACNLSELEWFLQIPGQEKLGNKLAFSKSFEENESLKIWIKGHDEKKTSNSESDLKGDVTSASFSSLDSSRVILPKLPCESPSMSMVTAKETSDLDLATIKTNFSVERSVFNTASPQTSVLETNDNVNPEFESDSQLPLNNDEPHGSPLWTASSVDLESADENRLYNDDDGSICSSDYDYLSDADLP